MQFGNSKNLQGIKSIIQGELVTFFPTFFFFPLHRLLTHLSPFIFSSPSYKPQISPRLFSLLMNTSTSLFLIWQQNTCQTSANLSSTTGFRLSISCTVSALMIPSIAALRASSPYSNAVFVRSEMALIGQGFNFGAMSRFSWLLPSVTGSLFLLDLYLVSFVTIDSLFSLIVLFDTLNLVLCYCFHLIILLSCGI